MLLHTRCYNCSAVKFKEVQNDYLCVFYLLQLFLSFAFFKKKAKLSKWSKGHKMIQSIKEYSKCKLIEHRKSWSVNFSSILLISSYQLYLINEWNITWTCEHRFPFMQFGWHWHCCNSSVNQKKVWVVSDKGSVDRWSSRRPPQWLCSSMLSKQWWLLMSVRDREWKHEAALQELEQLSAQPVTNKIIVSKMTRPADVT